MQLWTGAGPENSVAVGPRWPRIVARVSGAVFLAGSALNLTLTAVKPQLFGDLGPWMGGPKPLQELWAATMGAHPRVWGPLVGVAYEFSAGLLALSGDPRRRTAGLVGIALFHVGLLVMGLWAWALPVLAVLVPTIVRTVQEGRKVRR
jgi:hypothetical protein